MATNPKPTRKVRTTSARTPDGKKVVVQKSSKTLKNSSGKSYKDGAVVSRDGSKPIDKKTNDSLMWFNSHIREVINRKYYTPEGIRNFLLGVGEFRNHWEK
jgi:hypothetical protein